MTGFDFAPRDWAFCNGATVPITQNPALYSILLTSFGGDGQNTFALPDMRGRIPVSSGDQYQVGQRFGLEQITLQTSQMPLHRHGVAVSTEPGNSPAPADDLILAASGNGAEIYGPLADASDAVPMGADMVAAAGGTAGHPNVMPFQAVSFIIALTGTYPQRS